MAGSDRVDHDGFIEEVCWRTGLPSRPAAERIVASVLAALGARIATAEAALLAGTLPGTFAGLLTRDAPHPDPARRSFAAEHATAICQLLIERLDEEGRLRLGPYVPAEWLGLFTLRAPPR
jgi:uncharacterized protein (DUF2267 family)